MLGIKFLVAFVFVFLLLAPPYFATKGVIEILKGEKERTFKQLRSAIAWMYAAFISILFFIKLVNKTSFFQQQGIYVEFSIYFLYFLLTVFPSLLLAKGVFGLIQNRRCYSFKNLFINIFSICLSIDALLLFIKIIYEV